MNITNLITGFQNAANTTLSSLQLAILSKAVQKLNVGAIQSIANVAAFSASSSTAGDLFYSQADQEIYYNSNGSLFPLSGVGYTIAYAWGRNNETQIGDGTTTSRSSPVTVVGGITSWTQVSTYFAHALGLTSSGIAYAWGQNSSGELGDGTATNRLSPVTVVGGITDWTQIIAGYYWSLGLTSSGIAYGWGTNASGQLGDNTTYTRSSPGTVVGGITNWSQLSAGKVYALGLRSSGVLYAWGYGNQGQLGDNTAATKSSPVTVVGGITTWTQLAAGGNHSLGRTSAGAAYAWGAGYQGQLGDNTNQSKSSPVVVVGGITNWTQLSSARKVSGGGHSLGLTSSGVAYGWGPNADGQIGNNTASGRSSPVTVVGGITNWSQLACGGEHSLGRTSSGVAYGWGSNSSGQLGDGFGVAKSSPVLVAGAITGWSQIAGGQYNSVAIRTV